MMILIRAGGEIYLRKYYLIIPAVAVTALLWSSCSKDKGPGAAIDSRLKGYIPPKSKVLLGIDLDAIKRTDLFKRHPSQLAFPQLNALPDQIGLDPRRDLAFILFSWDGTDSLAMLRGSYRQEDVEKRLRAASTQTDSYNQIRLYGDGKRYVALAPRGVALVGQSGVVKGALTREATGGAEVPEDLHLRLALLNAGAQIWLVSSGVIPISQISMRSDAATALSNIADYIDGVSLGVTLGAGATFDGNISCISEEGSTRVHDALRGVIGLARLSTQENRTDQLQVWDSIRVVKTMKTVTIHSDLPASLADRLIEELPSLARRF